MSDMSTTNLSCLFPNLVKVTTENKEEANLADTGDLKLG